MKPGDAVLACAYCDGATIHRKGPNGGPAMWCVACLQARGPNVLPHPSTIIGLPPAPAATTPAAANVGSGSFGKKSLVVLAIGIIVAVVASQKDENAHKRTDRNDAKKTDVAADRAPPTTTTAAVTIDGGVATQGSRAEREDFITQMTKHPEFPFRVALGDVDTELAVVLVDPSDGCTTDLMKKFVNMIGEALRRDGFRRVVCENPIALLDIDSGDGSRASRQAFVEETEKHPERGIEFSFGRDDKVLVLDLTGAQPCTRSVLLQAIKDLGRQMRAAGFEHLLCKPRPSPVDLE